MNSDDDNGYDPFDSIDFSKMHGVFRELVFFEDVYLNMQAMNVVIVDQHLTKWEYDLLREYREIERTPTDTAMFVSAQTQMWIFALYELLRTWHERVKKFTVAVSNGGLSVMIENLAKEEMNLSAMIQTKFARDLIEDPTRIEVMKRQMEQIEPTYKLLSDTRVNLAKHQIPGKPKSIIRAPGYGRINGLCGAMDYEVAIDRNTVSLVNRRDIADGLRAIEIADNPWDDTHAGQPGDATDGPPGHR